MSAPWFYCPALAPGELQLADTEVRHALHSLRLRPGDELTLFDGAGHTARAVLVSTPPSERRPKHAAPAVRVTEVTEHPRPTHALTLIVAGCKGPRLDWLIEKATELGVARLILADFERSIVRAAEGRTDKLRRTALEACKQCRRPWLPEISSGGGVLDVVCGGDAPGLASGAAAHERAVPPVLVAHPDPSAPLLTRWLATYAGSPVSAMVVIGPEGGLTDTELAALRNAGATTVRLARHILRIETAAIAAASAWATWVE